MIRRNIEPVLLRHAKTFPVVTVTGPRQAGKTTLCRAAFPDKPYVSLEPPDVRQFAHDDPRGFLAQYADGAIIDEVQRVPDLLSYIQSDVDEHPIPGRFVLTGSANLTLHDTVSQSLAGRAAVLTLLPLTLDEVQRFNVDTIELDDVLWRGSSPAVFDRKIDPHDWYSSYVSTYVERDARALLNIGNLTNLQRFVSLCAGRTAQLINLSSLGADTGIRHATAGSWLSVLEASYLVWRLPPLHANVMTRLVKTPKLHFFDSGLVCYLLGIRTASQLRTHPLRGHIFETWVAAEVFKSQVNHGVAPALSFYRDRRGKEVDFLLDRGETFVAVEVKAGATIPSDAFDGLRAFDLIAAAAWPDRQVIRRVVFGGTEGQDRSYARVIPWNRVHIATDAR
ncbi:MAG: ATP-binding protein [Vicinamibacterales bacterium]|nr:ATP-binding protein [Vicinamibacterales bacterium]